MEIKEELVQAIYSYLVTKPMMEVEGLVNGIRKTTAENKKAEEDKNKPAKP